MQILKNISTVGLDSHPSIISMYIALNIYIQYIFLKSSVQRSIYDCPVDNFQNVLNLFVIYKLYGIKTLI